MRHRETHTCLIDFKTDEMTGDNWRELYHEIEFFKQYYPNAKVDKNAVITGCVSISYSGISNCRDVVRQASEQFNNQMKNTYIWWEEIL